MAFLPSHKRSTESATRAGRRPWKLPLRSYRYLPIAFVYTAISSDSLVPASRKSGIGEVIAGTEVLLNVCGGINKRIQQRDSLLLDMEIAEKRREKGAKEASLYEEARQKYDEVNTKVCLLLCVCLCGSVVGS